MRNAIIPNKRQGAMHKNWKAICQISDIHMMWALALLDMDSDLGRKFVERFPEYFAQEEQTGPYPLSLMRAAAQNYGRTQGCTCGEQFIYTYAGVPRGIPVQGFEYGEGVGQERYGFKGPKLPTEISEEARQGEIVTWAGKKFVVLENNEDLGELYIAPAECVHIDC